MKVGATQASTSFSLSFLLRARNNVEKNLRPDTFSVSPFRKLNERSGFAQNVFPLPTMS